jgi:hypothetical protein
MAEHHTVIKIKNPLTNRMIHFGTPLYAKLVREGVIEPYAPAGQNRRFDVPEVKTPPSVRNKRQSPLPIKRLQPKLTETLVETVADHRDQFNRDLTQEQTDRLLRKMLYEKLCIGEEKESGKKPKPKRNSRSKKDNRFKWKVKPPPTPPSSSSESTSDSDSDSE